MKRSGEAAGRRNACRAAAIVAVGLALNVGTLTRAYAVFSCIGDCNGNGAVAINELITLVNFNLGTNTDLSTCPSGIPAEITMPSQVTVARIIGAVNISLGSAPCGGGGGTCGDGTKNGTEDCDVGGTCLGGTNAGTHCTAESQCTGTGVCIGGAKAASACADASACPGGQCVHCVVQGGAAIPGDATHHCAANCTFETDITYNLEQGVLTQDGTGIASGSGAVVHGDTLTIPLALSGQSQQTLSAGKPSSDGKVPFVIKAASIKYPPIPVQNLACACVRGEPAKTCGGTIFEADGVTQALDCSDNFTAGASACTSAGKNP